MPKNDDGGPAFPLPIAATGAGDVFATTETKNGHAGMTLRDYFAAKALAAYASNELVMRNAIDNWHQRPSAPCIAEWLAGMAYEIADEMLAARRK